MLPQLLGGTIDSLHLSTDAVTVGGVTGAVELTARDVPLRGGDLGTTAGEIRVDEKQFNAVLTTRLPVDEFLFADPNVTASGVIEVFALPLPLSLTFTPGVADGDLVLTPVRLTVGEIVLDAATAKARGCGSGDRYPHRRRDRYRPEAATERRMPCPLKAVIPSVTETERIRPVP